MTRGYLWLVGSIVLILVAATLLHLSARGSSSAIAASVLPSVKVEHLEGVEPTRVTLSAEAAKRLDITLVPARDLVIDQAPRGVIPYAALIYDTQGQTWTYTNPAPLTFVRHPVTVDHITGDQAVLAQELPTGTTVVTVGAEELYGSETEFQEE